MKTVLGTLAGIIIGVTSTLAVQHYQTHHVPTANANANGDADADRESLKCEVEAHSLDRGLNKLESAQELNGNIITLERAIQAWQKCKDANQAAASAGDYKLVWTEAAQHVGKGQDALDELKAAAPIVNAMEASGRTAAAVAYMTKLRRFQEYLNYFPNDEKMLQLRSDQQSQTRK